MDTSKEYIKMCQQAGEIQDGYEGEGKMGDFVFNHAGRGSIVIREWTDCQTHQNTWLPRQDQLQKMLGQWFEVERFRLFFNWFNKKYSRMLLSNGRINHCISGEQLWLAFVMKEKHGKTWNGKVWTTKGG